MPTPVLLIQGQPQEKEKEESKSNNGISIITGGGSGATPLIVADVACGAAHVVAVSEEGGRLYSWGLNKSSQLGINTQRTQPFPAPATILMNSIPDPSSKVNDDNDSREGIMGAVRMVKVFCNGHSSAAIDDQGRLFTWGSTAHHRLMHVLPLQKQVIPETKVLTYTELRTQRMACKPGNIGHFKASKAQRLAEEREAAKVKRCVITTLARPTLVRTPHLSGCAVESFAFARTHSAALVLTCLKKVNKLLWRLG